MKKLLTLMIAASCVFAADPARWINITTDSKTANKHSKLEIYQGESVQFDIAARNGSKRANLDSSALPVWKAWLAATPNTLAINSTGTMVSASGGQVRVTLTPAAANVATGVYQSAVWLVSGSTYKGTVARGELQVLYSPAGTEPYTAPTGTRLVDLIDVSTNAPQDGQTLAFDADSGDWTNAIAGAGSGDLTAVQVGTNGTLTVASGTGPIPVISLSTNTIRLATAAQATNAYTWAVADAGGGSGDLTAVQVGTNNTLTVASGTGPVPVISLSTNTIRLATAAQATNAYTWAVAGSIQSADIDTEAEIVAIVSDLATILQNTDIDTEAELVAILTDVADFIQTTEIDTEAELVAILTDVADFVQTTEIDTEAELVAIMTDLATILQNTDIDTSAEIAAIVTDETGTGALVLAGNPTLTNDLIFDEQADHSSTPGAGKGYLWTKSTVPSTLIFTADDGTDTTLGSGGGLTVSTNSPVNAQILEWNASAGLWTNATPSASGGAGGIVWISAADFMAFDTGATDEWGHLFHELDSSTHSVEGTGIHTLSTTTQQGRLKASFATPKGSTAWSTTDAIRLRYWGDAAGTDNQILEVNFYGRNGTNDFAWIERHTPDVQPTAANNMEEIAWDLADIGTNTIYETYTVEILQSTRSSSAIWISGIALEFE